MEQSYILMVCPSCNEKYNVLKEWAERAKCPNCQTDLELIIQEEDPFRIARMNVDHPIGMTIGGCKIIELLGRGSMGAVYKARHLGLQRPVAVKMLPMTAQNRAILRRLVFEARVIAKLEHPNIVQVHDVGIQTPYLFIVMQLLEGQSLHEKIKDGFITLNEAVSIVRQIARGLQAAHSCGVVHRDLKPENIIITKEKVCKIMDFGLAKDVGGMDPYSRYIVGTPYYIAPEQWTNQKVDQRTDLYSLGIIFYYLICGRRPFEANDLNELMRMHLKVSPKMPSEYNKSISAGLSFIILKLLAKDMDKRYKTAKELLDDLERHERGDEVSAVKDFTKFVKCKFCDTLNPESHSRCKICGEDLRQTVKTLELLVREDEFRCPKCKNIVKKGQRSCNYCMVGFCIRCFTRLAVISGYCATCAKKTQRFKK